MITLHMIAFLGIFLFCFPFFTSDDTKRQKSKILLCAVFFAAFLLRIIVAAGNVGFGSDISCFISWSERINSLGPSAFYSSDVFTDYPPGYLYVLWLIGKIRAVFSITVCSPAHLILLKMPSILCDMVTGYLLYRVILQKLPRFSPEAFTCVYLFNPVVILNSAAWGQVDSTYTLLWLLLCLCLMNNKLLYTYFIFCAGLLIKPQMLLFGPVLFVGVIENLFMREFTWKRFFQNVAAGLSSMLLTVLLVLPFGFSNVYKQYFSTIESYPYAAVNACNIWGLFGKNWISQDTLFLGIPYHIYGMSAILIALIFTLYLGFKHKETAEKYPLLASVFMSIVFCFSVRMHERYLYPAVILLLFAAIYSGSKRLYIGYALFSIVHFYDCAHSLLFYDPQNYSRTSPFILITSFCMLASFGYFVYTVSKLNRSPKLAADNLKPSGRKLNILSPLPPKTSSKLASIGRWNVLIMLFITLLYSAFALYDLGDRKVPETGITVTQGETMDFYFDKEQPVTLSFFIGPLHNLDFACNYYDETESLLLSENITLGYVYTWQNIDLTVPAAHIQLTGLNPKSDLLEFTFLSNSGDNILPVNSADYAPLFDEQALHPERKSFRNSMYFDEIYHGRTAYEFLHGYRSYENTHPPLGKIFIALGVALFGMNPFGWRIIGTLFGIAMVPCMYCFAKALTRNTPGAALACVLFAFDFMHFTQTRIATIDVYITFFVLLMYWMMYLYSQRSFYDTALKKTWIYLGLCGLFMGLGIACKWTGVYAGIGLAVLFFATLLTRYREYLYAKQTPSSSTNGIEHRDIIASFSKNTIRTILFCCVVFVLIPAIIYVLSYLPFRDEINTSLIARMLHNQDTMFHYHSGLEATHPYASPWYKWPIMSVPIWYYSSIVSGASGAGGLREGISAFGNPLVWWVGIPVFLYTAYLAIRRKDRTSAFLCVGYLAQYLPWFFVTRITFIYHYFPSIAFVVLMITYNFSNWGTKKSRGKYLAFTITYCCLAFGLFLLFYPVLSGQPIDADFVDKFLRWRNNWVLVAR